MSELAVPRMASRCKASWLGNRKSVSRLAGEVADYVEVFVEVQHGESDEFCGGGDQQVCNRSYGWMELAGCRSIAM